MVRGRGRKDFAQAGGEPQSNFKDYL